MTREVASWARRVREERVRRLWSQKVMAVRLREAADEYTRARLPTVENIARRVRGYEAGDHFPGELYVELYCRAFGVTRDVLFGSPAGNGGRDRAVPAGEIGVSGLATWIMVSNVTDEAIRDMEQRRMGLAEAHTRLAPSRVLADVLDLHRQVQALLQGGRQRCWQARELFRIDAGLLAHASLLLDDIDQAGTATAHAGTAILCAEEAGCSPALALSAQAKTARWQGSALGTRKGVPHFARSADLARQGFECSDGSAVRVLLAAQEASAAALLGDCDRAWRALNDAEEAADNVPAVPALSTWACPGPRRALYALSVAIRLGDPDTALRAADEADEFWKSGEPWQYGVWSLIRIGAATAHVMKGDVEAASLQLSGIFALAPAFRITTMTCYLSDLDSRLAQRRFRDVSAAGELREQIRAFSAAADPAAPATGTEVP
jgi:hypothetical protein